MRGARSGETQAGSRASTALRIAGLVLAVGLGIAGVWMIVTASSKQWTELGVLAGLWGLLIGAFAAFGSRQPAPAAVAEQPARTPAGELERADTAAERHEFEVRLVLLLRHEVQATMTREIASLRAEVAALRTELIEKVGGQLRLERIETTRVIGSDIEALQREIDTLKTARPVAATALPAYRSPAVLEAEADDPGGRRRRRDEDGGNDLLSQILARETAGGRHSG